MPRLVVRVEQTFFANPDWEDAPINSDGEKLSGEWVQPGQIVSVDGDRMGDYYAAYCTVFVPAESMPPRARPKRPRKDDVVFLEDEAASMKPEVFENIANAVGSGSEPQELATND